MASNSFADCTLAYLTAIDRAENAKRGDWVTYAIYIFGRSAYGQSYPTDLDTHGYKQVLQLIRDSKKGEEESFKFLLQSVRTENALTTTQLLNKVKQADNEDTLCPQGKALKYSEFIEWLQKRIASPLFEFSKIFALILS